MIDGLSLEREWISAHEEARLIDDLRMVCPPPMRPRARAGSRPHRVNVGMTHLAAVACRLAPRPTIATALWYRAGDAMSAHVDCVEAGEVVSVLGLADEAVMQFSRDGSVELDVLVPRRALVVMRGVARWQYRHEVLPVERPRISIVFQTPQIGTLSA